MSNTFSNFFGISKYFHIALTNAKNTSAYLWDMIFGSMFVMIIIFVFANMWKAIYGTGVEIPGYTLAMMIWYLVVTESIVGSQGKVIREIGDEVKKGEIANYLNKPYHYLLFKYSQNMGETIFSLGLGFLFSSIMAYLIVGPIPINLETIPFILLSIFLGITLHLSMMSLLGISALWLEDPSSMEFIYAKLVFVAGGTLVPLEVFPLWFEQIAKILPFSYITYFPAKLAVNFSYNEFFFFCRNSSNLDNICRNNNFLCL